MATDLSGADLFCADRGRDAAQGIAAASCGRFDADAGEGHEGSGLHSFAATCALAVPHERRIAAVRDIVATRLRTGGDLIAMPGPGRRGDPYRNRTGGRNA